MIDDLLAAIVANPDDDEPRLVLADALIQRGDPWGELIVVDCELHRHPRTRALRDRRAELLRSAFPHIHHVKRGFCREAWFRDTAELDAPVFALLEKLVVSSPSADQLAALAAWPPLGQLSALRIVVERLDASVLEVVARAHGLVALELDVGELARAPLTALLALPTVCGLSRLHLACRTTVDAVFGQLAWPARLDALGLYGSAGNLVALLVSEAPLADLRELSLRFVDEYTAQLVARGAFTRLERLALSGRITANDLAHIAASPALGTLRSLAIHSSEDLGPALPVLGRDLRLASLSLYADGPIAGLPALAGPYEELEISVAPLVPADIADLLTRPVLGSLRRLGLGTGDRHVPHYGATLGAAIAQARLPRLESLVLDACELGEAGARALAAAPHLPAELDLAIAMDDVGAAADAVRARFPLY